MEHQHTTASMQWVIDLVGLFVYLWRTLCQVTWVTWWSCASFCERLLAPGMFYQSLKKKKLGYKWGIWQELESIRFYCVSEPNNASHVYHAVKDQEISYMECWAWGCLIKGWYWVLGFGWNDIIIRMLPYFPELLSVLNINLSTLYWPPTHTSHFLLWTNHQSWPLYTTRLDPTTCKGLHKWGLHR